MKRNTKKEKKKRNKGFPYKSYSKMVQEEIEELDIDYYVIAENSYFEDDVEVKCDECKELFWARSYYPRNKKLICLKCLANIHHK